MIDSSEFDKGIFLVNVLGIVYSPEKRQILIGKRENDPYLKDLHWGFPGGRPGYEEELEAYLKEEIQKKTGLTTEAEKIVYAKSYPEKREFLSIYYLCKVTGGEEKAGEKFTELMWVKPSDVDKHFTTSVHPKLLEFLKTLD